MCRLNNSMKEEIERNITVYGNPLFDICQESNIDGDEDKVVYIHSSGRVFTKEFLDNEYRNSAYRNFTRGYYDVEAGYYDDTAEDCLDKGVMYKLGREYAKKDLQGKGVIIPAISSHYMG